MAEIKIIQKFDTYWDITVDGNSKLAISTGIPNRVFGGSDMSKLKSVPGYIWERDNSIREWKIEGLAELDNQIIFWGAPLSLIPVSSPFTREELKGAARLFQILLEKSETPAFSVDSFFRLPQGKLFCFPLNLMEFIHSRQSKELLMSREAYNHPDLKKADRLSHTMAILTFQSATGVLPFAHAQGYEWIHEEMRNKKIPSLKNNDMKDTQLIQAVDQTLACESYPTLDKWISLLESTSDLRGTMNSAFKASMERQEENFVKSFNRRKNSIKISISILLAAMTIWIGTSFIRSYIAPPYTADMAPREVVEAYYEGINNLDTTAIDGTTARKAGKAMSNQVATMYVMSKNKQAYSQGSTISPEYWKENDYVTLPVGYSVYGVGDLKIEDLGNNKFRATYYQWYPPSEDIDNPTAYLDPHEIYKTVEELTVVRDKRDRSWIIGDFDKISSVLIPSNQVIPQPE